MNQSGDWCTGSNFSHHTEGSGRCPAGTEWLLPVEDWTRVWELALSSLPLHPVGRTPGPTHLAGDTGDPLDGTLEPAWAFWGSWGTVAC